METDWRQAPDGARWWAVDADGQAHWYWAPDIAAFTDFWYAASQTAPLFGFAGNWRKSLVERKTPPQEHP